MKIKEFGISEIIICAVFSMALLFLSSPANALVISPNTLNVNLTYGGNTSALINFTNNENSTLGVVLSYDLGWFSFDSSNFALSQNETKTLNMTVWGLRAGQYNQFIYVNYSSTFQTINVSIFAMVSANQTYLCPPGMACLNSTDLTTLLNVIASNTNQTRDILEYVRTTEENRRNELEIVINQSKIDKADLEGQLKDLSVKYEILKNVTEQAKLDSEKSATTNKVKMGLGITAFVLFTVFVVMIPPRSWRLLVKWLRDKMPIKL